MSDPRPFHRLFGLSWIDFFEGTTVDVRAELDLSIKQQLLDLVLIRRGNEPIPRPLPDSFEELAAHNLVTFKSHQEALAAWTLWELVGHFVNYRKQSSPSLDNLLPETDYRLFAVCTRFPHNLEQRVGLLRRSDGVYDITGLGLNIRVVVVNQLPLTENNAMLHLYSQREELLRYEREHYRPHSAQTSKLLLQLFEIYSEDPTMADPRLEAFFRETLPKTLKKFTPEQRLDGLSAEEIARALPPEILAEIIRQHKTNGSSPKPPE